MAYRANVSDTAQEQFEAANFDDSVPVMVDQETRHIWRGEGGVERVASAAGEHVHDGNCAGVVMNHKDYPGLNMDALIGRAG